MWKRYGRLALLGVLALLAAFAGFLAWRAHSQKTAEAHGEEMSAAMADMQAGRKTDAGKKLDALVAEGGNGYRVGALFTKAGIAAENGDAKAAAAIYAGIAADQGAAQPYRDAALLRQTLIEYDGLAPQQVIDRLKPLTTEDNAFFGTAGELSAIAMIQLHRSAEAGRLLATISRNPETPSSLRARAGRLASSLGADVTAKPADKD